MKLDLNPQLALPAAPSSKAKNVVNDSKGYYTARELYNLGVTEIPWLVDNIFLKSGIMVLSGSSDVGKSTLLRQLTISVGKKDETFLGWNMHVQYGNAIYVSTEDDKTASSYALNKTLGANCSERYLDHIRYVFDTRNLLLKLDKMLTEKPADCIIIDAFGDLYGGQLNQLNNVRKFFEGYFQLVNKHGVLVLFLHHTGKRTEALPPNKNNLIGSQGIEGKARQVIELRKDPINADYRHLCIVKGNYIPESMKTHSFKLKFNDDLTFEKTEERVDFDELVITPESKQQAKAALAETIAELHDTDGLTFEQVAAKLKEEGEKIGKSTAHKIYTEHKKQTGVEAGPPPNDDNE